MYATIRQCRCGWHVSLSVTGTNMSSLLKPTLVGKSCVPYRIDATKETLQTEAEALAIGLYNICGEVREDCKNL
jgi:hypothetical protein